MAAERSSEVSEPALEHQVALEVLELGGLMLARQRKIDRHRAYKIAAKYDVNHRTALQLLERSQKMRQPRPRIRSEKFFTENTLTEEGVSKEAYYAELKTMSLSPVAKLAIYHTIETDQPDILYDFTVRATDQPVMVKVFEQDRMLTGDELYAPLGFLLTAKALYETF